MGYLNYRLLTFLFVLAAFSFIQARAQTVRGRLAENVCSPAMGFNGVFQIDLDESDKLYTVIEEASSNVPFADQQQFFIDLAVRLTPPDLLALECRENRVLMASSRAARQEFVADGVTRTTHGSNGKIIRTRIALERNNLIFYSRGDEILSFTFTPLEQGKRLRVTRRISSPQLIEPVVINTLYNKISETARWDVFSTDPQIARQPVQTSTETSKSTSPRPRTVVKQNSEAEILRRALDEWIKATNSRDIENQMSFYQPQLKAFYLTRNVPRSAVREEKRRAFLNARSIQITAAAPEIIFQDGGQTAVMRFRKKYNIQTGARAREGEVVQELRWQQTGNGWKIFSERDIRVLR